MYGVRLRVRYAGIIFLAIVSFFSLNLSVQASDTLKIQLRWKHQFQFAGYYIAKEKGFYESRGLDVELIEGGPQALSPIADLLSGKVDFAITGSGVAIDRMEGQPVVAVAAIMQTSPIVWITLKSSHIRGPLDMADSKLLIMPPPESAELLTMLASEGIRTDQLTITPTTYRIEDLIDGKADAYDGYISNEPYLLKQKGVDYNIINPRDYGVNFYSDVLITTERMADDNAKEVKALRDATLQGWEYALNNIEETVQLIHKRYAPEKTLDHLRYEAETIKALIMPELVQLGHMNPGRWQYIADSYRELAMTNADSNLEGFLFTPQEKVNYQLTLIVGLISILLLSLMAIAIFKFRSLSTKLAMVNAELNEMVKTDYLTQVRNRHGFTDMAEVVLSQSNRQNQTSSFILFDIDFFKSINDKYGHQAGDKALVSFAGILSAHRRQHDIVARLGGEEFGLLLSGADKAAACSIADKILSELRELKIQCPNAEYSFSMTASAGVATLSGTLETFWHEADKALYKAKESGRDRYCHASSLE